MKKITLLFLLISSQLIHAQVTANGPFILEVCDDDYDGFAFFDLTSVSNEIIGGQTDVILTFHEYYSDATNGTNEINNPEAYQNTINPQNIYTRVEDLVSGDYDTNIITVSVLPIPSPSFPNPLIQIDYDEDGFEIFDLTLVSDEVINGDPNVILTFFETYNDAEAYTNPIADPTAYQNVTTPEQTLYIRVEFLLTGCYTIVPLLIVVESIPDVPFEIDDFVVFDENGDGVAEFDLTLMIPQIIGGQTGLEVSFYETEDDAQNKSNVIEEPQVYENISNPQTIYARTETIYSTYALTVFSIFADENLIATSFGLDQLSLYPNPAGNFININFPKNYKDLNLEVVSLNGQLLISNNFTNRTSEAVTLDLSSLNPGVYFIKITTGNNQITKKLVKK